MAPIVTWISDRRERRATNSWRRCARTLLALVYMLLPAVRSMATPAVSAGAVQRLIFLGDSLTEGYGVSKAAAYPTLVEAALRAKGYRQLTVINAGISGSTSASAPGRVKWLLRGPDANTLLFVALGANDGLRGLPPPAMAQNLISTVAYAKAHGVATVVLAGMQMPPNYGGAYREAFAKVFPQVAASEQVKLMPFLLDGVAADPHLNQADGIHPNEAGHKVLAERVVAFLLPLLGPP